MFGGNNSLSFVYNSLNKRRFLEIFNNWSRALKNSNEFFAESFSPKHVSHILNLYRHPILLWQYFDIHPKILFPPKNVYCINHEHKIHFPRADYAREECHLLTPSQPRNAYSSQNVYKTDRRKKKRNHTEYTRVESGNTRQTQSLKNSLNTLKHFAGRNSFFANEPTLTKRGESVRGPFSPSGPPHNQPFGGDVVKRQIWYSALTENKKKSVGVMLLPRKFGETMLGLRLRRVS